MSLFEKIMKLKISDSDEDSNDEINNNQPSEKQTTQKSIDDFIPIKNYKDKKLVGDEIAEFAIDMLCKNNLESAIQLFTKALSYHCQTFSDRLNRCYCYLRMNKNKLALADADYVINNSTNNGYLFMAKVRAGQASFALEKFKSAETYFKEACEINPENHHVKRELLRVKVVRLVTMGYNKKDALLALEKNPTVMGAANYISDNPHLFGKFKQNNLECLNYNPDDTVYASDEDEKPTSTEIMNRILNYRPGKGKLLHMIARPSTERRLEPPTINRRSESPMVNRRLESPTLNRRLESPTVGKDSLIERIKKSVEMYQKNDIEKNIEISKKEKNIEISKKEKNIEIPKNETKIEIPKKETNIEIPKNETNIEIPKVETNIEIPKVEPTKPVVEKYKPIKNINIDTLDSIKKSSSEDHFHKVIWVGSLTNAITDKVLTLLFAQFGNITRIIRPLNQAYALINFETDEAAAKALKSPFYKIGGVTLKVRAYLKKR